MVSLVDLLSSTYAPVQITILPYLDIADIINLTRTCKGFDQLLPVLKATAWNVNHYLRYWFSDPQAFRSLQSQCSALIVGSVARHFLLRRINDGPMSMKLVVTSTHKDAVHSYLESDDYTLKNIKGHLYDCDEFRKVATNGQEVFVFVYHDTQAVAAQVLNLHSTTASMVFISWNKVYALFAFTLFINSEFYLLDKLTYRTVVERAKLAQEG